MSKYTEILSGRLHMCSSNNYWRADHDDTNYPDNNNANHDSHNDTNHTNDDTNDSNDDTIDSNHQVFFSTLLRQCEIKV